MPWLEMIVGSIGRSVLNISEGGSYPTASPQPALASWRRNENPMLLLVPFGSVRGMLFPARHLFFGAIDGWMASAAMITPRESADGRWPYLGRVPKHHAATSSRSRPSS